MRFPYQSYPILDPQTNKHILFYRPVIPVRIIGPAAEDDPTGLLDTGCDETLFPDYMLDLLRVTARSRERLTIGSLGNTTLLIQFAVVDLEIRDSNSKHRWSALVGFHDSPGYEILLGYNGFLRHFTATFNGLRRHVTLTSNGTFPKPISGGP